MALPQVIAPRLLPFLLPRPFFARPFEPFRTMSVFSQHLGVPILSFPTLTIPSAIHLNIPSLLSDIWESILRAVPKKKTSHRKKRQRFMAGKGLKDVESLNKCSACGNIKRAHLLCPYCVRGGVDLLSLNTLNND